MAAIAYLLPPVTGLFAFTLGSSKRVRFHGLQSVALGFLWPLAIYGGSLLSPGITQGAFIAGAALWLLLLLGTAVGRDPGIPGARAALEAASEHSVRS